LRSHPHFQNPLLRVGLPASPRPEIPFATFGGCVTR
jgi:hypothetical protein